MQGIEWLVMVAVVGLLLVGVSAAVTTQLDPINQFFHDGKFTFSGGTFTGALFSYLQNGPQPGNSTWERWALIPDGYQTASYHLLSSQLKVTPPPISKLDLSDVEQAFESLGSSVLSLFGSFFSSVFSFDWLIGHASAVDRFAVYGDAQCTGTPNPTTLVTDADCWSTTTGGDGDGLPVAADNLVFDASSGAGTGTFDASLNITTGTINTTGFTGTLALATFILTNTGVITHDGGTITSGTGGIDGGVMTMSSGAPTATVTITGAGTWRLNGLTIQAGGTFTAGGATVTMDGSWNSSAGTFTYGTSTVVFAASGTLTTPGAADTLYMYNLTVNAGITLTLNGHVVLANNLIQNGGITDGGVSVFRLGVRGGAACISLAAAQTTDYDLDYGCTVAQTLDADFSSLEALVVRNSNLILGANLTITDSDLGVRAIYANSQFNTAGFSLTITTTTGTDSIQIDSSGSFVTGASSVSTGTRPVLITSGGYITSTALGTWTVSGAWTNASTSALWSFVAPILFDSATGGTMTFAGTNLAGAEFNNVTFTSSAGTAQTFTMATRGLNLSGALMIADTSSTTTLDTSASSLSISANIINILTGGILTGNAATLVTETWNQSGTFNQGTTEVIASYVGVTVGTFYDLTINAAGFVEFSNLTVDSILTMDGFQVGDFNMVVSSGSMMIIQWLVYSTPTTISWRIFSSVNPNTKLTATFNEVQPEATYLIRRNGVPIVQRNADVSGSLTFIIAGNWPVDVPMTIVVENAGFTVPIPQQLTMVIIILMFMIVVLLAVAILKKSGIFYVFSGLSCVIFLSQAWTFFGSTTSFASVGFLVLMLAVSVILILRGALGLPEEFG